MYVAGLFLYPVKSLRGCAVPAVELDALGFAGDRRFLVVDDAGKFLTQRTHPRMALIEARLAAGMLLLTADGAGPLPVAVAPDPAAPRRSVAIWKHEGLIAEDCGTDASRWLSDFLGQSVQLVRIGPQFHRHVLKKAALPGDLYAFQDGSPVLVVSEASLAALNDRIQENGGEAVPLDRFRPSLVLAGCDAFAEDTFPRLRIGAVTLRNAGKSDRCIVTATDQRTGERGKEPLRTLAAFRRDPALDPTAVYFGANFINESKLGALRVGDAVTVAP
ncbi:MAG: MOSC domain-containing protein [Verrucomicrobiota bacterium]